MTLIINIVNIPNFPLTAAVLLHAMCVSLGSSVPCLYMYFNLSVFININTKYKTFNKYNKYGRTANYNMRLKQTVLIKLFDVPILCCFKL